MRRIFSFNGLTNLILCITLLFSAFGATAEGKETFFDKKVSAQTLSEISEKLSLKLKTELADNSVSVKINGIQKRQENETLIDLKGTAFCILSGGNNRLPIEFEAKINAQTEKVGEVTYNFVEDTSPQFEPTSVEEVLMKELMKKVGADYKTDEIVIAIDGFEMVSAMNGREFEGAGEIKIGEVEWSKISFDVVLDDNNSATKIEYHIE